MLDITPPPNTISESAILSAFLSLVSLFFNSDEVQITKTNVAAFQYLANALDNKSLSLICHQIFFSGNMIPYFFSSRDFLHLSLDLLNNFSIILEKEIVPCNSVFASLITHHVCTAVCNHENVVDFSSFGNQSLLKNIFDLLKGYPVDLRAYKSESIYDVSNLLGFSSLITSFFQYTSSNNYPKLLAECFGSLPLQLICLLSSNALNDVLSVNTLKLRSEDDLFKRVSSHVEMQPHSTYLLQHVHGAAVSHFLVGTFVSSLTFSKVDLSIFIFLKNCFRYGYFVKQELKTDDLEGSALFSLYGEFQSKKASIQFFLSNQQKIEEISQLHIENQKTRFLILSLPKPHSVYHENLERGMNLLRENYYSTQNRILAAELFKELADEGDPEACWRVVAFYSCGHAPWFNRFDVELYADIASDSGSLDGIYWRTRLMTRQEDSISTYHNLANQGYLPAKWELGFHYSTSSNDRNPTLAIRYLTELGNGGDGYWTQHHAWILSRGSYGFKKSREGELYFKEVGKNQPISESSIFRPGNHNFHPETYNIYDRLLYFSDEPDE